MRKFISGLVLALLFSSVTAFSQTRTPSVTRTPTPVPTPVIVVNQLPTTWASTNQTNVLFAFRQAFFVQFWQDPLSLDGWNGFTALNAFIAADPNPNTAVSKMVSFLVILRQNGSGLYDLLAERHDSGGAKIAQAFTQANGNVANAADYTMQTQGVSRYLAADNIVANDAAGGIDALAYLQVNWCDVAPSIAYAAWLKVGPQLIAAGIPQRPFPCAVPTVTPTPVVTPTPTPVVTPTPTPTPPVVSGAYTVTVSCSGCVTTTLQSSSPNVTVSIVPKSLSAKHPKKVLPKKKTK